MSDPRAVVLNGASSSGKTSLARALQERLDGWWLHLGVDTLITAMPARMYGTADGLTIGADGSVRTGSGWRLAHDRWRDAVGGLVRSGADVIVDEVFLEAAADQARWRATLDGLPVLWVGVHCEVDVAASREGARGDRAPDLARWQSSVVHVGVDYDVVVDTTAMSPSEAADVVAGEVLRDDTQAER